MSKKHDSIELYDVATKLLYDIKLATGSFWTKKKSKSMSDQFIWKIINQKIKLCRITLTQVPKTFRISFWSLYLVLFILI